MFSEKKSPRSSEVKRAAAQDLSEDFKRKISELHLQIQSGCLSNQELRLAKSELQLLRDRIETRMVEVWKEASTRIAH